MATDKSVLLGMSGGTDSFVTALLLKDEGYHVKGVTFKMWRSGDNSHITQAEELAASIGIEHKVIDISDHFDNTIVSPFVDQYLNGRTPNPCAYCNPLIKWDMMLSVADEMDCRYVSTGHYIRIKDFNGLKYIYKGIDPVKDQSYFLWRLNQNVLNRAITPLGDYKKEQVRSIARERGYSEVAGKKESMGICFLQGQNYRDYIEARVPDFASRAVKGDVVNESGEIIGEHNGIVNYTVGQKRDVNCFDGRSRYVKKIDSDRNIIVAGSKQDLNCMEFVVDDLYAANIDELSGSKAFTTIVRGLGLNPEGDSFVIHTEGNRATVKLTNPAWAMAPGQPVAFYDGERLVGGGVAV